MKFKSKYKKGSNQYQKKVKNHMWQTFYYGFLMLSVVIYGYKLAELGHIAIYKPEVEKAHASQYMVSPLAEPTPEVEEVVEPSEKEKIVAYITRLWEKHGTDQVVRAINCFYSESGLRTDAYGVNTNGTDDAGVAQINSIHGLSKEERFNWKKNLDKAYHIYTSWGNSWSAWYGKLCG